jgi:hypothetical protein
MVTVWQTIGNIAIAAFTFIGIPAMLTLIWVLHQKQVSLLERHKELREEELAKKNRELEAQVFEVQKAFQLQGIELERERERSDLEKERLLREIRQLERQRSKFERLLSEIEEKYPAFVETAQAALDNCEQILTQLSLGELRPGMGKYFGLSEADGFMQAVYLGSFFQNLSLPHSWDNMPAEKEYYEENLAAIVRGV